MTTPISKPANQYITGWSFRLDKIRTLRHAWRLARQHYPSFQEALLAFRGMVHAARLNTNVRHITKGVAVDKRVYTLMGMPGRPSKPMDRVILTELHRSHPMPNYPGGLMLLLFAITKKCPLRCEHCFEWDVLNQKETLSLPDILAIIHKFQRAGVAQVELSGGEPLHRFDDITEILRQCDTEITDFWLLSSGYRLTLDKATTLKSLGLRGISISLDHWSEPEHDRFRGMEGSYDWAMQAVQHARQAGLVVSLSLVPTHDFCTAENLWRYAALARALQVHFIRILEPRAVGHYAGMPVELTDAELEVLENFVQEIQHGKAYRDYPLIEFHASYQRIVGCGGAGKRYLYVDTDGDIHACPFCRTKWGKALETDLSSTSRIGQCPSFKAAPLLLSKISSAS